MVVAKNGVRAGAAAFLFGFALTVSPATAAADEPDPETTAGPAGAPASSAPARATRGSASNAGTAARQRLGPPRPAAARQAVPAAPAEASTGSEPIAELKTRPTRRGSQSTRDATDRIAAPARSASDSITVPTRGPADPRLGIQPEPSVITGLPSTAPAPEITAATAPANTPRMAVVAAAPTAAAAPVPADPAPVTMAGMTAATGTAAVTVADLFNGLLAPIREFFEGAALLVRRALFNQAPTVSPVQLTGQGEGPITGTIGAVDPEGDPIVFSITTEARYGSAVIDAAGNYTYTPGPEFAGTDSFIATATDNRFGINLLDLFRAPGTAGNVAVSQGASADRVQFQFIYGDGAQFWSPAARSTLEYVATTLSTTLTVDSPVVLTYTVTGEFSPFSSTLASAGSDLTSSEPGFLQTVAQNKILSGTDANGSAADGTINWNFGPGWAFGDNVPGNQYDFQSTAMHELLHTLGFLTYVDQAGANTGRSWTDFDSHLVTSDGTSVIGGDYVWNTAYNPNLTGGNGGLYFGGPNATAAYGGFVPLYTPRSWSSGSSLSHLDDSTFVGANQQLMNARSGTGPGIRIISPIEAAILEDLGYSVAPGPAASALMFVGLIFLRRRHHSTGPFRPGDGTGLPGVVSVGTTLDSVPG